MVSQTILVTGAGAGIGLETARLFAAHGHRVIGTTRNEKSAEQLKARFASEGHLIETLSADLTDAFETGRLVEQALALGDIDIVINNAGVGAVGSIEETDDESTDDLFAINFHAPIRLVRGFAAGMRQRHHGAIINVSSMAGKMAQPFEGLYSASKHALEAMTEQLYYELKPFGIRVASIQPGRVETDIRSKLVHHKNFLASDAYSSAWTTWQAANEAAHGKRAATSVQQVAEVIYEAATTQTPRLRWLVGDDAELVASALASGSFEDFEGLLRTSMGWQS